MSERITNTRLHQLLVNLGFHEGEVTAKHHRFWHHKDAGTTLVLPDNKTLEEAAQTDLLMLREHLHYRGHMMREDFDTFLAEGELAARV